MENAQFNPFIRACAAFGAVFCILLGVVGLITLFFSFTGIIASLFTFIKSVLVIYMGWGFWIVFKFGQNPFKLTPFSKF